MQGRQRMGPANGYRSNSMGIRGVGVPSRISPEGSMRGHRVYNTDHRNYNRGGYGRGGSRSRQFQPPLPPPRETDIFVEAGRLAAEYLVSKGVLPPTALSGKWRNDGVKNQLANIPGFRPHEDVQSPFGGRESTHSRFGSSSLDVGAGRRRYSDEYNSVASKNSLRGKRSASFKDNESEVIRELGRSASYAETSRASPLMDAESDAKASSHDEQPVGKSSNDGVHTSSPGEINQEGDRATHLEPGLKNTGVKANSSYEKSPTSDADVETIGDPDDANKIHMEIVKEGDNDNGLEQKQNERKEVTASAREDPLANVDNVPTAAHSKQDQNNKDENNAERHLPEGPQTQVAEAMNGISAGNDSSSQNVELKSLEPDVLGDRAMDKGLDATYSKIQGQCLRSESFPVHKEQEHDQDMSGFGRSNSLPIERGEKRVMDDGIDREGFKRLRQWAPSMDIDSDGCLPLSSAMDNRSTLHEQTAPQSTHATLSPERKSLSISLFPKGQSELSELMQEKQLFPASFKTCDLNLGTSDANENHDADSVISHPSIPEAPKEVIPIGVDLSMSNNFHMPKRNGKNGINNTDIEVIDLDNDSAQEDQAFNNHERRGDTVFTDLVDGFPNNIPNANEIPGVQDGYGLMISELLGNGSPSCSTVPSDLNSLHNDVGLPNGEGILGDDDSIYMSLGEIPISFMRPWEQPTQDYGKPF